MVRHTWMGRPWEVAGIAALTSSARVVFVGMKCGWIWELPKPGVSPQIPLWGLCQHRHWVQRCRVSPSELEIFFWPHCWKRKYKEKALLKFHWITLAKKGMSMLYPHLSYVGKKPQNGFKNTCPCPAKSLWLKVLKVVFETSLNKIYVFISVKTLPSY